MKVYIVRHGETDVNKAGNAHQSPDTPLSDAGRQQARLVAERFIKIPIDHILASPYPRAKETAEIISQALGKTPEFTDTLIERIKPSIINGMLYDDPVSIEVRGLLNAHYNNPAYRHSDEETFFDIKVRAEKALEIISNRSEDNVLVVSHSYFIHMLIGVLLLGEDLTPDHYLKISEVTKLKNTGITMCEYNREKNTWKILTTNDYAHLG